MARARAEAKTSSASSSSWLRSTGRLVLTYLPVGGPKDMALERSSETRHETGDGARTISRVGHVARGAPLCRERAGARPLSGARGALLVVVKRNIDGNCDVRRAYFPVKVTACRDERLTETGAETRRTRPRSPRAFTSFPAVSSEHPRSREHLRASTLPAAPAGGRASPALSFRSSRARSTNAGKVSAAFAATTMSASAGVSARVAFISTTGASPPACKRHTRGSSAAGYTESDVPTTSIERADAHAAHAARVARSGSASPKSTQSNFAGRAPHPPHVGARVRGGTRRYRRRRRPFVDVSGQRYSFAPFFLFLLVEFAEERIDRRGPSARVRARDAFRGAV